MYYQPAADYSSEGVLQVLGAVHLLLVVAIVALPAAELVEGGEGEEEARCCAGARGCLAEDVCRALVGAVLDQNRTSPGALNGTLLATSIALL